MESRTKKRHILLVFLLVLGVIVLFLGVMFLTNPIAYGTFDIPFSETATREFNLTTGRHVRIWLSAMPPGMSGRSAQSWVIRFYVTNPSNNTIMEDTGIAAGSLAFVAHEDGIYTLHFSNTVGGNFSKTVSISYRMTQSIYGVPIQDFLLIVLVADIVIILIVAVTILIERNRDSQVASEC